jgi:hypothetical protein
MKNRTTWAAAAMVLMMVLGSCGLAATTTQDSASAGESTSVPDASSDTGSEADSPIEALLGFPGGDDAEEYFSDLSRQAEVKIAECMLEQGFQYTPSNTDAVVVDAGTDFDSRAFAEQYGFGIASNPFDEIFEQFDPSTDPNTAYFETLSDGEKDAYNTALYGEISFDAGSGEAGSAAIQEFEPAGCQGSAFEEVFAVFEVFGNFEDEFAEIERSFAADPRIVQAAAGWSTCMADAGYRYTDEASANSEIQRRYDAIVSNPDAFPSSDEVFVDGGETGGANEVIILGPQTLTPEFQAQVDELAIEERAIATATWDCNADLRAIEDEVRREYEQRFVDEHGADITARLGNN